MTSKQLLKIPATLTILAFGFGWSFAPLLAAEGGQGAGGDRASSSPQVSHPGESGGQGHEDKLAPVPPPVVIPAPIPEPKDSGLGEGEHSIPAPTSTPPVIQHEDGGGQGGDFVPTTTPTSTPPIVHHEAGSEVEGQGERAGEIENENGGGGEGQHPAITAALAAQDFGAVNYDTGLGILKGYTAGFGLSGTMLVSASSVPATFAGVQSVVVQLYSSTTLLETNTALPKVGLTLTGANISSPFDVLGSFDYVTDGYWTNVRAPEYGLHLIPTRVVATVKLVDGQILTAQNTVLTGDPTIIVPAPAGPALSFIMGVNIGSSSASVLWLSSLPADARIWISTTTPVVTTGAPTALNATSSIFHFLTLTGLLPGTLYHYIVASGTTFSPEGTFMTAP